MRQASQALKDLLLNQQVLRCNLYTITLVNGVVLRYTDADVSITADGQTWSGLGPSISGARLKVQRGLEVDKQTIRILHAPTDTVNGVTWHQAARSGALDGAEVAIDKGFAASWAGTVYRVNFFAGLVASAAHGEQTTSLEVTSDADKLNVPVPRIKFQPGCVRTLYSSGCGVNRAAFTSTTTVSAVASRSTFATPVTQADGYFALGYAECVTGANAGARRAIRSSLASGAITLARPFEFLPSVGDQIKLVAGCDKSHNGANGCPKFNNVANFQGFPYVPTPETQY